MPLNARQPLAHRRRWYRGLLPVADVALRRSVEGEEDKPEHGAHAIQERQLTSQDVLVGIASSGQTPYVIGALKEAHTIGATTMFLCCVPPPEQLKGWVTHFITPIVGPEIITGSTRLKAGTATKLVLNMLTTASMIKLGKVYNNLMVDVNASNTKLVARSIRIVQTVTGVDACGSRGSLSTGGRASETRYRNARKRVEPDRRKRTIRKAFWISETSS